MRPDRREFLKGLGSMVGATVTFWPCRGSAASPAGPENPPLDVQYQYRTISIEHLSEVKEIIDKLNHSGQISSQPTFQAYLKDLEYQAPKDLPHARSLILAATPWRLRSFGLHWNGKEHRLLVPGGYFYYEDAAFREALKQRVAREVLKNPAANLVFANPALKTLSVRSGLAEYGKNNIAYVDGYGSFHVLWAFFTEAQLSDQWVRPLRLMRLCKGCSICLRSCPTKALSENRFELDAGRCITLYNEMKDPIPEWVNLKAHNALIGCLKCQFDCPADREVIHGIEHVADLTEKETALLMKGRHDPMLEALISEKLKGLGEQYAKDLRYLSRNVRLALANSPAFEVLQ